MNTPGRWSYTGLWQGRDTRSIYLTHTAHKRARCTLESLAWKAVIHGLVNADCPGYPRIQPMGINLPWSESEVYVTPSTGGCPRSDSKHASQSRMLENFERGSGVVMCA